MVGTLQDASISNEVSGSYDIARGGLHHDDNNQGHAGAPNLHIDSLSSSTEQCLIEAMHHFIVWWHVHTVMISILTLRRALMGHAGCTLCAMNKVKEAKEHFLAAIRIMPNHLEVQGLSFEVQSLIQSLQAEAD